MIEGQRKRKIEMSWRPEGFDEKKLITAIEQMEREGYTIGEGKTATYRVVPESPSIGLKRIHEKTVSPNRAHQEMELLERALRASVRVPKPLASVETNGSDDYLFMETIEGFSLRDLIGKDLIDQLPPDFDFKAFFKEVRTEVEKMHASKLYHRDLHGGNILIDKLGKPVIIDFGDATINFLSSDDPYRFVTPKGDLTFFQSDEDAVTTAYREAGAYLKAKGYFERKAEATP